MLNSQYAEYVKQSEAAKNKIPQHLLQNWQNYIAKDVDPVNYTKHQKNIYALAMKMYEMEQGGRSLFHLTVTYKPYGDRVYSERDVNTFFINFYTKKLLPYVMGTKNYHTNVKKAIQPICYCFIDEHENTPTKKLVPNFATLSLEYQYNFAERLHHHAILAVSPETLPIMQSLVGINSFANTNFSPIFMTSDLKQCDAGRILYASKMLYKYPDFLSFPDSLVRHRN
mgnify:CR=1 FL=1